MILQKYDSTESGCDDDDDESINKFADDFPIFQRNLTTHKSKK